MKADVPDGAAVRGQPEVPASWVTRFEGKTERKAYCLRHLELGGPCRTASLLLALAFLHLCFSQQRLYRR